MPAETHVAPEVMVPFASPELSVMVTVSVVLVSTSAMVIVENGLSVVVSSVVVDVLPPAMVGASFTAVATTDAAVLVALTVLPPAVWLATTVKPVVTVLPGVT